MIHVITDAGRVTIPTEVQAEGPDAIGAYLEAELQDPPPHDYQDAPDAEDPSTEE